MFYVYIYLDPRKKGKYKYNKFHFAFEPFYVGKGKCKRSRSMKCRNFYFLNKVSKIHKGKVIPAETRKKMSIVRRGKKKSEETRLKMRGMKNSLGFKHTEETRKKMSKELLGNTHLLGHRHTEETKQKISERGKLHKHTEETKRKLSLAKMGVNNPNWKGGNFLNKNLKGDKI